MLDNRQRENAQELKIRLVQSEKQATEYLSTSEKTTLCIKNMVSIRCKMVVQSVLENLGISYSTVELGEVEIIGNLPYAKHEQLRSTLLQYGLELVEDKKLILVEKIKKTIVEMIHYSDDLPNMNFSDYLSEKLNHNYGYLSNLFSEAKGMSIQQFIIAHKIERVKELLAYDELSLSEIAWKLHYSSAAHLSNQFKKFTHCTPSQFKHLKCKGRNSLEEI